MNRDYADGVTAENITFFVGLEVEHTAAYGMETLFVTGVHDPDVILDMAKEHGVKHIYFGANQSFPKLDINDVTSWRPWENMIKSCLQQDFWCTLDFDVSCVEGVLEGGLNEYRKFISMISVKIPYINQFNYHATVKIDDKDFEATNPGVWTHRLRDLQRETKFTDWDQYKDDEIQE